MTENYRCNYCSHTEPRVVAENIRDWEYGVEGEYSFLRCTACQGVQLHPFPNLDDLRKAYDIDYHGYAEGEKRGLLFSILYAAREALFNRKMQPLVHPQSRVLDVGCGQGDFLRGIARLGVNDLVGIDFNPDIVEILARHRIQGYAGTFDEYPATPGSFDLVAMNNYLEHTLAPVAELKRTLEVLKPGGYLVGEVPGFDSVERRLFGRYWGGNHVPRHTYQFDHDFLRRQLTDSGFVDVEISHQLNTSHLALSVQNYLQRKRQDLRNNPAIRHGRGPYYVPLLLLFIPINLLLAAIGKSGCVQFQARKPGGRKS